MRATAGARTRWALLGCLAGVLAIAPSTAGAAAVRTAGCPEAFEWKVRVELHRTPERRAEDPEMAGVVAQAQQAADMVGQASGCAAAIAFDVVDDPAAWDTSGGRGAELGRLREREAQPGPWQDVDVTLLSRPPAGEESLGTSDYSNIVTAGEPHLTLIVHELLHVFERFYAGAPWPDRVAGEDAIHEIAQWGYKLDYDGVVAFQRDLLAGTVGGNLGMPRHAWAVPETLRQRKARLRETRPAEPAPGPAPPTSTPTPTPDRPGAAPPVPEPERPWSMRMRLSVSAKGKVKLLIQPAGVAIGQKATIRMKTRAQRTRSRVVRLGARTTVRLGRLPRRATRGTVTVRVAPFSASGTAWAGASSTLKFGR